MTKKESDDRERERIGDWTLKEEIQKMLIGAKASLDLNLIRFWFFWGKLKIEVSEYFAAFGLPQGFYEFCWI